MKDEPAVKRAMGPAADGSGWVNNNHTCIGANCNERLPLPEWQDKFCPKCGTQQPGPKMHTLAQAAVEARKKECPKCQHINEEDANFCIMCGTKLPVHDSIVKGT